MARFRRAPRRTIARWCRSIRRSPSSATVGGVVAANSSGPRRRLYGTARDLVIGMTFATLEGKLVETGGMVVKNVAGLDMAKLMIGSFGTLAAIATVNFKLLPMPEQEQGFCLPYPSAADAIAVRNRILASALQPSAIDLLNPAAAATFGISDWMLAMRTGGNPAAMRRNEATLAHIAGRLAVETGCPESFWPEVENFTPHFLHRRPEGAVVRASCTLKEVAAVMESFPGPAVARAASGVCYGYFEQAEACRRLVHAHAGNGMESGDRVRAGSAQAIAGTVAVARGRL